MFYYTPRLVEKSQRWANLNEMLIKIKYSALFLIAARKRLFLDGKAAATGFDESTGIVFSIKNFQ